MKKLDWLIYFGGLTALSILTLWPDITLLIVMLSFGLATPLLLVPNILLYSAALLPVYLTIERRRWARLPLAVLPGLVVALLLPVLSIGKSRDYVDAQQQDDRNQRVDVRPARLIEIFEHDASMLLGGRPEGWRTSCDEICQSLLVSGEVSKVRITRWFRDGHRIAVTYAIETRDQCSATLETERFKAVIGKISATGCLVASTREVEAPQARITLSATAYPKTEFGRTTILRPSQTRRITVELLEPSPVVIWRQTEVTLERAALPFYLGYDMSDFSGHKGKGWQPGLKKELLRPINIADVLKNSLGFSLQAAVEMPPQKTTVIVGPANQPVDPSRFSYAGPSRAERLAAAAERNADTDFIRAFLPSRINSRPELKPADIERIAQSIADPRIDDMPQIHELFNAYGPALTKLLLPAILQRLAVSQDRRDATYRSRLAAAAARLPAEDLRPYREQILALLSQDAAWPLQDLLKRVGELGGDPTALLASRLRSASPTIREAAAIAACQLGPPLASLFASTLFENMKRDSSDQTVPTRVHRRMLIALAGLGYEVDATSAFLAEFPDASQADSYLALNWRKTGDRIADCDIYLKP